MKHRQALIDASIKWQKNNPEKIKQYARKYRQSHKTEINTCMRIYKRKRKFSYKRKLNDCIGSAIRTALHGKKAGRGWESLVGYTLKDLIKHLENLFDENMSWDNRGSYWQIDHIKPQSLFYYENAEDPEFKKCWELKNLQPLEAMENRSKSNHY